MTQGYGKFCSIYEPRLSDSDTDCPIVTMSLGQYGPKLLLVILYWWRNVTDPSLIYECIFTSNRMTQRRCTIMEYSLGHKFCTINSRLFCGPPWGVRSLSEPIIAQGVVDYINFFCWEIPNQSGVIQERVPVCLRFEMALFPNIHLYHVWWGKFCRFYKLFDEGESGSTQIPRSIYFLKCQILQF